MANRLPSEAVHYWRKGLMSRSISMLTALAVVASFPIVGSAAGKGNSGNGSSGKGHSVQIGPRAQYLVNDMDEGPLKDELLKCSHQPMKMSDFSIGHRGAAMQFPEHTRESYTAAARMGASILECDVAVTADGELVCRHDQCDLHTTTDVLDRPLLAARCGGSQEGACCTIDFTLAEIKSVCGLMDGLNPPSWRTDLYGTCGEIMSHAESIELIDELGAKFTPELKEVKHLPAGYSYDDIRQKIVNEYIDAGIDPRDVWLQSFFTEDVEYWIANEAAFGVQAVFLDARVYTSPGYDAVKDLASMQALVAKGARIIAPPTFALLEVDGGRIVPSEYAVNAKAAGLEIITWTLERSGRLSDLAPSSFYYQTITDVVDNEGDMMTVIDVLAREVGVLGIFSDWPAALTYYANCMGIK